MRRNNLTYLILEFCQFMGNTYVVILISVKSWALAYIINISVKSSFLIAQQSILFTRGKNKHYAKNPNYIRVHF